MSAQYTLSQVLDLYFITRMIDKKKHFAAYLTILGHVYSHLHKSILWKTKSVWVPIRRGRPHNFVEIPCDSARILSVSAEDKCKKIVPLFYNTQMPVLDRPRKSKCGCTKCDCSGLCGELSESVLTTKKLFSLNGVDYFEKKWVKLCKNGDIKEYREVPVKRCVVEEGDGDFNDDFNDDFSISAPFTNHEIVTRVFEKTICALEVKPCGCPVNTPDNENLVWNHCGEYINPCSPCGRGRYDAFAKDINSNRAGQVNIGECGRRIYVSDLKHQVDHLLIEYQTDGLNTTAETLVPENMLMVLWTGVDHRSKMFNNAYSAFEKEQARQAHEREITNFILFQNPIDLEFVSNLQDAEIKW